MEDAMILESTRFGKINYRKTDIVRMVRGLLGFDQKSFIIIALNGQEPFKWLHSLDDPDLAFLVIDPHFFIPDYSFEINSKDLTLLGADNSNDISTFVLVTIPKGQPDKMSVNLQGPVIINKKNLLAAQLVLGESIYEIRHPIFRELDSKIAAVAAH